MHWQLKIEHAITVNNQILASMHVTTTNAINNKLRYKHLTGRWNTCIGKYFKESSLTISMRIQIQSVNFSTVAYKVKSVKILAMGYL